MDLLMQAITFQFRMFLFFPVRGRCLAYFFCDTISNMNFSSITNDLFIGTTPSSEDYNQLRGLGIKLIINMRVERRPHKDPHPTPLHLLWLDGADIMLFSSASPGRGLNDKEKLESARWVERVTKAYASMFTSFVAHANRVGYEDGLHFWGGATAFDPNGEELAHGPYNEEAITYTQLDLNQLRRTRARLPLLRDERTALTRNELNRILARA